MTYAARADHSFWRVTTTSLVDDLSVHIGGDVRGHTSDTQIALRYCLRLRAGRQGRWPPTDHMHDQGPGASPQRSTVSAACESVRGPVGNRMVRMPLPGGSYAGRSDLGTNQRTGKWYRPRSTQHAAACVSRRAAAPIAAGDSRRGHHCLPSRPPRAGPPGSQ